MIRTAAEYLDSIRDGRQVWINGEKVDDVPTHPMFKPLVDVRARIYDMQHDPETRDVMTYQEGDEPFSIGLKLPHTQEDWHLKRASTDRVMDEVGGVVTRVGDETVGEMWSLFDGQDVLNEVDPQFSKNIRDHVERVIALDPFHLAPGPLELCLHLADPRDGVLQPQLGLHHGATQPALPLEGAVHLADRVLEPRGVRADLHQQ